MNEAGGFGLDRCGSVFWGLKLPQSKGAICPSITERLRIPLRVMSLARGPRLAINPVLLFA